MNTGLPSLLGDKFFGSYRWWRKRAGGRWYRVRLETHPSTEVWRRVPPDGSVGETLAAEENW